MYILAFTISLTFSMSYMHQFFKAPNIVIPNQKNEVYLSLILVSNSCYLMHLFMKNITLSRMLYCLHFGRKLFILLRKLINHNYIYHLY